MSSQAILFLLTVVVGMFIGFIYDIFRIIRKVIKHKDFFIFIEDTVYWLIVSFVMFYFMLSQNNGEIRFFAIMGAFIGMILYFYTISIWVMKVSMTIINIIKKIFNTIFKIIMFPVKIVIKIIKVPLRILKKIMSPFKKVLKKIIRYVKIKLGKLLKDLKVMVKKV